MIDRFRNARPAAQVGLILGAAAGLAIALALLWFYFLRVNHAPLFTGMRPAEAAAIVAELERQKVPYRLSDAGATISVPADRVDAARLSLSRDELSKNVVGFELFNKSDMGVTEFAQKINYQRALQGELERTLAALDGVETARVHLSMGNDRLFREDRVDPKASVTLRMVNSAMVPPGTVDGVQHLVSAAVPQLDAAAVVILDEGGQVLSAVSGPADPGQEGSPRVAEKRALEQYYEARVRGALDRALPPGGFDVTVWMDTPPPDQDIAALPGNGPDRTVRMQVTLAPKSAVSAEVQANARSIAAEAIGYDASLGDAIVLGAVQPGPAARSTGKVVRVANSSAFDSIAEPEDAPDGGNGALVLIALAIGVVFVAVVLRRFTRRPLDEKGKVAFAERLRTMIENEEDANGRPAA